MMKVFATIKSIAKMALWSLSSLSVGLAAVVVLSPENPSLAKYVLDPVTYSISMESYANMPLTDLAACTGIEKVGQTLTGGALTPSGATATYQWQKSATADGTYADISGATSTTYTLTAGDYGYFVRLSAAGTGVYTGTVYSPYKGPVQAKTIDIAAISGVTFPITGNTPGTTATETDQYTAAVSWSPAHATFQASTVYTATITLTPKSGYTVTGVTENFFTVSGATSVTNAADSGVVTAVFPSTAQIPVTAIGTTTGIARVGQTLTAGAITPAEATVTYQWTRSSTAGGIYTDVSGATSDSYILNAGDLGYYFKVTANGTGGYSGSVTADAVGPVAPKPISQAAIFGVSIPVTGNLAATTLPATAEYTAAISWSPTPTDGIFQGETVYTATVTLSPKAGYTVTGVTENFFTVSGASSVTNAVDSGVVTAMFPSTSLTPVTAIGGISGVSKVGETLTAGALTPVDATVSYQWKRSIAADGSYTDISGATSATYVPTAGDYNYFVSVSASGTENFTGTVTSPYKGPIGPMAVNVAAITGVATPVTGNTAVTTITPSSQFTGTVSWSPALVDGKFAGDTVYTATITLIAKSGFTLTGVAENFFTLSGSASITNAADSGVLTAVFPSTALTPLTAIGSISGTPTVGQTLTAGALTPVDATVTYQWRRSATPGGEAAAISGATASTYTLMPADLGAYISAEAIATGGYSGFVFSPEAGPVQPKVINIAALSGLTPPATGASAPAAITQTAQYTGSVLWSPAPVGGVFQAGVVYTATVTLTPKTGYTLTGVSQNFFTVFGATTVTNTADSGVVTVVFPSTSTIPITAIEAINGVARVGQALTAGALTPSDATTSYQWQRSLTSGGTYEDIAGAASASYTLTVGDLGYFIRVTATGTGGYSGSVTSFFKGPVSPKTISIAALDSNNNFPMTGVAAFYEIASTVEYTGTITWSPEPLDGIFQANTIYTATVTITPKTGYTTDGVPENFFYVTGATSSTNPANSGVVTVVCPSTDRTPVTGVSGIVGPPQIAKVLVPGDITPLGATVEYQWQISDASDGTYVDIPGATASSYTVPIGDLNKFIRLMVGGTGDYSGRVSSPYKGPIELSPYSISTISGIGAPVENATAATVITETAEYTGTVSWSPALVDGKFAGSTVYTATVTLTPKAGYTATGIPANFFSVPGSVSVVNSQNSGVITVEYPSTNQIQITAIAAIIGTERAGNTLTAGALTPANATATYQWQRSLTAGGSYTDIAGATTNTYTVTSGDFDYYLRVVATGTGSSSGTATSPYKGPVEPTPISISAIMGVTPPVTGGTAVTSITETAQYTGTVSWSPTPTGGLFQSNTIYTATITLTPKAGFTASGVSSNFFTVAGAVTVTNPVNSGVVTAVFPSTALTPITAIAGTTGLDQVGKTLTAGAITPAGATVSYQWQRSTAAEGPYTNIAGATNSTYTIVAGYFNNYIRVVATGTGAYAGSATSPYKGPIAPAPISRAVITGLTPPVKDAAVDTTVTATNEYTASVSWSPTPPGGFYAGNTVYTATVTLTPNSGYTATGVPANFFSVAGASSVTNSADSSVVTVVFPSTEFVALTAVGTPTGTQKVGSTLTAGALTPASATVSYQWQRADSLDGLYTDISGATSSNYTLTVDDYTHFFRVRATGTGDYAGSVLSDAVGPIAPGPITIAAIPGVGYPLFGETAATTVTETAQYTGSIAWSPTPPDGVFAGATVYTATITLTPKTGFTATGVAENFFTVVGASSVTNPADSAVVTALFPSTALTPLTEVVSVQGIEQVGYTLTPGALVPSAATATYQWMKAATPGGTYTDISGATSASYQLLPADYGYYFKVRATGSGDYSGAATSPYRGPIEPAPFSIPALEGIGYPVLNATAATIITETTEYTGSISWSPALTAGKFAGNQVYTATITLQPKNGYTAVGVAENFYTVAGASSVTNAAGSGIITAVFPSTSLTPIQSIGNITGTVQVDQTLTAGALDPIGATATYQWQRAASSSGPYTDIAGATNAAYTVTAGDYTGYLRVVATGSGEFMGVATSSAVGPVAPAVIDLSIIEGIPVPVKNAAPVYTVTATNQYTGTVTWSPNMPSGSYRPNKIYTATITLTPKFGYTVTGVPANFFVVPGSTTQSNPANSGVITATYPKTRSDPLESIEGIGGVPKVGETLTAGAVSPTGATVVYQWLRCPTPEGTYQAISGATSSTYTATADDYNHYLKVSVDGSGDYIGNLISPYKGPIQPALISISAISGVTTPATGATPVTTLPDTAQYTAGISWSPAVPEGVFEAEVIYTATITVTPKNGYTLSGIPTDYFTVAGSTFIANDANSGVVTAEFPETFPTEPLGAPAPGSFFKDIADMLFAPRHLADDAMSTPTASAESMPAESTTTDSVPSSSENVPAESAPIESATVENAPIESAPAESTTTDSLTPPSGSVPVESAPTESTASSADSAITEGTAAESAVPESSSTGETPIESEPGSVAESQQDPANEPSTLSDDTAEALANEGIEDAEMPVDKPPEEESAAPEELSADELPIADETGEKPDAATDETTN